MLQLDIVSQQRFWVGAGQSVAGRVERCALDVRVDGPAGSALECTPSEAMSAPIAMPTICPSLTP
ncbi:hypothetical protein BH11GEM2_BH11GEM2_22370 [soil metagenome]